MLIKKNTKYRVKGKSEYFLKKYGTYNPEILIEDRDTKIWGGLWLDQQGNPTCLLFAFRVGQEYAQSDVDPLSAKAYYGKISTTSESGSPISLGELVFDIELEKLDG